MIGRRLHELILNPPMKIDGILPQVSSPPCAFKGWVNYYGCTYQKKNYYGCKTLKRALREAW